MSSWAPRWFATQWSTVDEYQDVGLPVNETPESKLGDKRWKRDTVIARGNELCSLDISTFDNADLATLYEHLLDVDETLLHIKDDWPIERFIENDQLIVASHISREQIAADETQASIAKRLIERHDHIRAIINKGRLGRKLSLNDLPIEIINRIIDHCEDNSNLVDNPAYVAAEFEIAQNELNTIKSLRLTCHKLNELATPRLVPAITVSPTEASLKRLENISRHGVFGKNIKRVRLIMGHYCHFIAGDPEWFSKYALKTIYWAIEARNRGEFDSPPIMDNLSIRQKETLFRLQRKLDQASEGFDPLVEGELPWEAYCLYKQKHREYHDLMIGGHYVRRVAEAVARLPRAHRLDVCDYTHDSNDWRRKYADTGRAMSNKSLIELLTAPMEWNRLAGNRAGNNLSADALGKLLPALGKLGVRLKVFEMNVTSPVRFRTLFTGTEEFRLQTSKLLRDVWFLRLCIKARPMFAMTNEDGSPRSWGPRLNTELRALHGFVDTLLKSPISLQWLQLNFESLALDRNTRGWVLLPAMTSRKTSHSCRMDLLHISLNSEELDAFLSDGPLFLTLGAPVMKRGTWMSALRTLRQKFKHDDLNLGMRRRSSFPLCMRGLQGLIVGGIQFAEGAECSGMGEEDYENAFGKWEGLGDDSHAMDYIHHKREDNPFSGHS